LVKRELAERRAIVPYTPYTQPFNVERLQQRRGHVIPDNVVYQRIFVYQDIALKVCVALDLHEGEMGV
jgi:hypothetical protein